MNKSKKHITFAERARKIISKYKRADFDSIEREQMERELDALAAEQEEYKRQHGIEDNTQTMQHANGIDFNYLNADYDETPVAITSDMLNPNNYTATDSTNLVSTNRGMLSKDSISPYKTSIIPSIASGAISTLGNLWMANRATKDLPTVSLGRVTPSTISLARERSRIRKDSRDAARIARTNAAKNARTRGEYLSLAAAQDAAINEGTAKSLSDLYSREAQYNAAERARASSVNAELASKEALANYQSRLQAQANRDAYLSAALQSVPQMVQNIAGIRQQDALINSLGQDYSIGMYRDPNLNFWQRLTTPKQIVRVFNSRG